MQQQEKGYLADELAGYVAKLSFEHLPPEVSEKVKLMVLDTIGVTIYGSSMPWAQAVYQFVKQQGGEPQATIVRFGGRTSATLAAFVNGTFAHSNDFDDQYALGPLHSSASVWTAIPVAEMLGQGGKDVITSIVIGYDITTRLAEACFSAPSGERALTNRGFQGQAVCGVLASAAQTGKQLGLDPARVASALGIAGSYPGGTIEFLQDGSDTKRFHFGKASQQGITAAMLAQHGFKGPRSIIEGHKGFLHAYSGDYDASKVTEDLGKRFDVMWASIKYFPVMYGNETAIEAFLALVKRHNIKAEDVEEVDVKIRTMFVPYSIAYGGDTSEKYDPSTSFSAQMSIPYNLAIAMEHGTVRLEHFEGENWRSPGVSEFAKKVKVEAIEDFDRLSRRDAYTPSRVTIKLKDGRKLVETRFHPKGDPRNPMTYDEVCAKFFDASTRFIPRSKAESIVSLVGRLEEIDDIRELTSLLH
ncbi:MAG: MmgE/PrpD family protein [Bacillota bacterium]|nr:MmgE/PrpD family protein [Bacillota bacterium]